MAALDLINDDAIAEILLRLPPDDPACLVHAALVCKLWHRILSEPTFPRRYRKFHRTPPLLGFFHHNFISGYDTVAGFVPTTSATPFPQQELNLNAPHWDIIDTRHGRVFAMLGNYYVVWDPITGVREVLPYPASPEYDFRSFAVLCPVAGCDHSDCNGGPYLVIFLSLERHSFVHACVYSSETRAWGARVSVLAGDGCLSIDRKRGALTRDNTYYCQVEPGDRILKYELGTHSLSVIDPPSLYDMCPLLMPNDDGSLGLAGVKDSSLYLWSRTVNPKGIFEWIQRRVIELDNKLFHAENFLNQVILSGFAEDAGFIYMTTHDAVYAFELNSGQVRKVSERWNYYTEVYPFNSFYTPDFASSKLPPPAKTYLISAHPHQMSFMELIVEDELASSVPFSLGCVKPELIFRVITARDPEAIYFASWLEAAG
ncbi:hypothetical protein EJB05_14276, partial [Eragrostis curvula]